MNPSDPTEDPVAQLIELSRKPSCTAEELKAAYLRIAKQLHPDHGGNAEQFRRLQTEYETALSRLKHGFNISSGSKRFVPWAVESRRWSRKHVIGGVSALTVAALVGSQLQMAGMVAFASGIAAVLILLILPLVMASSKSHLIALLLVIVIPVSLAFVVGLSQSNAATRLSEGRGESGDMAIASLVLPAAATLLASVVGLLFWLAGDRN